jgi:hypothetical protein
MPSKDNSSVTSFGTSGPRHTEVNSNGIVLSSEVISVISTQSARNTFVLDNTTTIVESTVFNGAKLDEDLRIMIQNLQKYFMEPYVDFRMDAATNVMMGYAPDDNLEDNIQNGFLYLDPSTNVLTRNVMVDGVQKTTTEKLMIDLNDYLIKVRERPENIDISNNEAELIKKDDAYLLAIYGLKTITVTNRGLLCWLENKMLNDTIIALQEDKIKTTQMQSSLVFDITATATLDIRYLAYLKKHVNVPAEINGVPNPDYDAAFLQTGVFDAALLAAFI